MSIITAERLRELLSYDPETGVFRWRVNHRWPALAGMIAGTTYKPGYRIISVDGRQYRAGRLAFFYMTGRWPREVIDHKNLVRDDDRWENLREASHSSNLANARRRNSTGFKGVCKHHGKWMSVIGKQGGGLKYLGIFNTAEEAAEAYKRAAIERWGEFARAEAYLRTEKVDLESLGLVDGSEV